MLATNDSSEGTEHAFWLADNVWCILRRIQGSDRFVPNFFITLITLNIATERIASSAFEIVTRLNKGHFLAIVRHGAFADLTVCVTEFCKVSKYQKISLLAIAMLRDVIPVMLECPDCSLTNLANDSASPMDDAMIKFWFPVLFGFYDIIMNGEDLEVRRLYVYCFSSRGYQMNWL